jgi:hypothetical protein
LLIAEDTSNRGEPLPPRPGFEALAEVWRREFGAPLRSTNINKR